MPISKIQVNEYECIRCRYKWINRINGIDGPVPNRCAKCKTSRWNTNAMTPKERGLRKRIKGFKMLYENAADYWSDPSIADCWSDKLAEIFLNIHPGPTIAELKLVMRPPELAMEPLNSRNQYCRRGYVRDPEKPDYLKFDQDRYIKNLKFEAGKRQQVMQQIINARNIKVNEN